MPKKEYICDHPLECQFFSVRYQFAPVVRQHAHTRCTAVQE